MLYLFESLTGDMVLLIASKCLFKSGECNWEHANGVNT